MYPLALRAGRLSINDFFISSAMNSGWAHRIGSLGLGMSSSCIILVALARLLVVHSDVAALSLKEGTVSRISRCNCIGMAGAFLSALGMVGVAAFNVHFCMAIHFSFAFAQIEGLTAFCFAQSYIDSLIWTNLNMKEAIPRRFSPISYYRANAFRKSLCWTALIAEFGGGFTYPLGFNVCAATCELIVFFALMTYFWTWFFSPSGVYRYELRIPSELSLRIARSGGIHQSDSAMREADSDCGDDTCSTADSSTSAHLEKYF